jgi:hypothetical protein
MTTDLTTLGSFEIVPKHSDNKIENIEPPAIPTEKRPFNDLPYSIGTVE